MATDTLTPRTSSSTGDKGTQSSPRRMTSERDPNPANSKESAFTPQAPSAGAKTILTIFVAIPLAAVLVGVPVALFNGWVTAGALAMLAVMYAISIHGITIGYHRLFTHRGFKPTRALKIALAVAGSAAVEGRLLDWVGDHRKHHQLSDKEGDPHSPWEYGNSTWGLTKGLAHAHLGWIFTYGGTDMDKYAPDIANDKDLKYISDKWPLIAGVSLALPGIIGYIAAGPWGAVEYLFWATVVRVALVHHVTWSVNSICHVFGRRPFVSRDKSGNVAWLAPISGGESWHSYHHADPTSARHGVLPGQLDTSAVIIYAMEKLGWVTDVRWPSAERIAKLTAKDSDKNPAS